MLRSWLSSSSLTSGAHRWALSSMSSALSDLHHAAVALGAPSLQDIAPKTHMISPTSASLASLPGRAMHDSLPMQWVAILQQATYAASPLAPNTEHSIFRPCGPSTASFCLAFLPRRCSPLSSSSSSSSLTLEGGRHFCSPSGRGRSLWGGIRQQHTPPGRHQASSSPPFILASSSPPFIPTSAFGQQLRGAAQLSRVGVIMQH